MDQIKTQLLEKIDDTMSGNSFGTAANASCEINPLVTAFVGLLKSYPFPTDLDIVVLDGDVSNDNYFVKIDTHIGINAAHLPVLACQFRDYYTRLKQQQQQQKQQQEQQQAIHLMMQDIMEMMDATSSLLCVCPDNSTAWADRSRSILSLIAANRNNTTTSPLLSSKNTKDNSSNSMNAYYLLQEELQFLNLLFTRHSSKPSPWSFRKWICKQYIHQLHQDSNTKTASLLDVLLHWATQEIDAMVSIVKGYPKNYYAWTHRIFVVQTLLQNHCSIMLNGNNTLADDFVGDGDAITLKQQHKQVLLFLEGQVIQSIEEWLPAHVSDHSAVHFGATTLQLFIDFGLDNPSNNITTEALRDKKATVVTDSKKVALFTWALDTIQSELNKIVMLLGHYSNHEALWLYRRYCCLHFFTVVSKMLNEEEACQNSNNVKDCASSEQALVLTATHNKTLSAFAIESLNTFVQKDLASMHASDTTCEQQKKKKNEVVYSMTFRQWVWFHLLRLKLMNHLYEDNLCLLKDATKASKRNLCNCKDNNNEMWNFFTLL